LKGFEEVHCENILNRILSALHKGGNFSLWEGGFGKSEYFSNVGIREVLPFFSRGWNILHCGAIRGWRWG